MGGGIVWVFWGYEVGFLGVGGFMVIFADFFGRVGGKGLAILLSRGGGGYLSGGRGINGVFFLVHKRGGGDWIWFGCRGFIFGKYQFAAELTIDPHIYALPWDSSLSSH